MKKRKKQYFNYMLQCWKQHKHIKYEFKMMRIKDWYRLTEIVKRGGPDWFEGRR